MAPNYNPANWYWYVAGDRSQVFSSVAQDYVPVSDATFMAWLAAGGSPTTIDSAANLGAVLAPLLLRPVPADVLDGYTSAQADEVVQKIAFKVLFNHENRIRALEGKAALTAQQARATVKGLM